MTAKAKSAVSDSSSALNKDTKADKDTDTKADKDTDTKAAKAKDSGNAARGSTKPGDTKPLSITLLHGRGRHVGWVIFGGVAGGILLVSFGTIGKVLGALLVLIALQQAFRVVQTFLREPGTFRVDGDQVRLPTGLCQGEELKLERAQIDHVFFLRRAVPWTQAGPLLVVETQGHSYSYPRDWFASDSDQRRVETALNRQLKLDAPA